MRVLITGGRDWTVSEVIRRALEELSVGTVIVHGAQRGADTIADGWAHKIKGLISERHPAEWRKYGKKAGPIRNQKMVDLGADLCLAFPMPASIGTWDCIQRANAALVPVDIWFPDGLVRRLDPEQIPAPRPLGMVL